MKAGAAAKDAKTSATGEGSAGATSKGAKAAAEKQPGKAKKTSKAALRKRAQRCHRALRWAVQIGFFIAAPELFSAGMNGVKYAFTQLGAREPLVVSGFLITLAALLAATVLFGRVFCGWACAFGTLGDAVYALFTPVRRMLKLPAKPLSDAATRVLYLVKYLVLAAICALCFAGAWSAVSGYSPWTAFAAIIGGSLEGVQAGALMALGLVVLGMAFVERFFCQFLCPLGALFSLMPVLPCSAFSRDEERCSKSCGICKKGCPVSVYPDADALSAGECIACGRCSHACPLKNAGPAGVKALESQIARNAPGKKLNA